MKKLSTVLAALALSSTLSAQTWTVGTPTSMLMSAFSVWGNGGCYPGVQATLNLNYTPVDGMVYYYEVANVLNGGFFTMVPGPAGGLNVGDTIHVGPTGSNQVFNQQVSGMLELRLIAAGTPTTAGQTYPCAQNDLWLTTLPICNVNMNKQLGTNCSVQPASTVGITEANEASAWYASNGNSLRILDAGIRTAQLLDMQGRVVATTTTNGGMLELGAQPAGIYIVRAERADGSVVSDRVALVR
jgi:hypothetical protein